MMQHNVKVLLGVGVVVRLILLVFGSWQDAALKVKYTDIDYRVYTDAARFLADGKSPYARSTYRYSPLLAILMVPNIWIHDVMGKVMFCIADIVSAMLMQKLMTDYRRVPQEKQWMGLAVWLFSPFTVTISTRGNGEAMVTVMLLTMLLLLYKNKIVLSGMLYGLAVHWRIYPILYSLPILRHLALQKQAKIATRINWTHSQVKESVPTKKKLSVMKNAWSSVFSMEGLKFGLCALGTFLGLGYIFYQYYGWDFIHETYLYHFSRIDPRHNFSPYFYPAYLIHGHGASHGSIVDMKDRASSYSDSMRTVLYSLKKIGRSLAACAGEDGGRAFVVASIISVSFFGWKYASDLVVAFLLQTVAFVSFNKVATAQYFVWYLSWFPMVLNDLLKAQNKPKLLAAAILWTTSLGHWLAWAYALEFQGQPVHFFVWGAGLLWVLANAILLNEVAKGLLACLTLSDDRKSK